MSQTMGAPSTIPPGTVVLYPDSTTGVVGSASTLSVPDNFVASMQSLGFVFANTTSLFGPALSISPTKGIGYAAGAGGVVTQASNKSTGVTLSDVSGQITMNAAALADATTVSFTVTNTTILATDNIIANHVSGGTAGAYIVQVNNIAAGSFKISVRNVSGGSLSEAIVIGLSVLRGANA